MLLQSHQATLTIVSHVYYKVRQNITVDALFIDSYTICSNLDSISERPSVCVCLCVCMCVYLYVYACVCLCM